MSVDDRQVGGNHYKQNKIQPWTYILENNLGWLEGNIVKYITRWEHKGGIKDLEKVQHYLDKLIERHQTRAVQGEQVELRSSEACTREIMETDREYEEQFYGRSVPRSSTAQVQAGTRAELDDNGRRLVKEDPCLQYRLDVALQEAKRLRDGLRHVSIAIAYSDPVMSEYARKILENWK